MIAPVPTAPFVDADKTVSIVSQRWLQSVRQMANPPQNRVVQTVGASPWVTPVQEWPSVFLVTGGTVTLVEYSGDNGQHYDDTGMLAGTWHLPAQHLLRLTFSVAPDVVSYLTGGAN